MRPWNGFLLKNMHFYNETTLHFLALLTQGPHLPAPHKFPSLTFPTPVTSMYISSLISRNPCGRSSSKILLPQFMLITWTFPQNPKGGRSSLCMKVPLQSLMLGFFRKKKNFLRSDMLGLNKSCKECFPVQGNCISYTTFSWVPLV